MGGAGASRGNTPVLSGASRDFSASIVANLGASHPPRLLILRAGLFAGPGIFVAGHAPDLSAHHLAASLGNQPRGALIARVNPQPADRDAQPVAQADQKIDMRDAPYPPRDGAAQLDASEIDHRLALADLRQAAGMFVVARRD